MISIAKPRNRTERNDYKKPSAVGLEIIDPKLNRDHGASQQFKGVG